MESFLRVQSVQLVSFNEEPGAFVLVQLVCRILESDWVNILRSLQVIQIDLFFDECVELEELQPFLLLGDSEVTLGVHCLDDIESWVVHLVTEEQHLKELEVAISLELSLH